MPMTGFVKPKDSAPTAQPVQTWSVQRAQKLSNGIVLGHIRRNSYTLSELHPMELCNDGTFAKLLEIRRIVPWLYARKVVPVYGVLVLIDEVVISGHVDEV
ncbi:hypothetical protein SLS54_005889 [Diplodia seriata]